MKEKNPYSFKSDVYSYGIVLYEMISYSLPYPHISNIDTILYMVGKGTLKPDMSIILDTANLKLVKLCEKCIEYNPDLRPTFHEIVSIVSQAFYIVPIIARTTSCLHLKAESDLNVSQTSINMIKNSYLIPSYVNNLREAHSDHNINRKSQEDLNKKII
uniref:Raf homolog serine/threonine-protein kinase phl (Trinotate prediction) n=1 Tax=Henneguya salminicola TaxID=69463 RepID=A0A6G3MLP6_HENSL